MSRFLLLIVLGMTSMAQAMPTVVVKGVVVAFDEKKITLKQPKTTLFVPRRAYPNLKKVHIGRTQITVQLTPKEMLDFNPLPTKK